MTRPVGEFYKHLNRQSDSIKFTMEKEVDGVLPFLDLLVRRKENKIETEVFRKAK
jgi:hypothetical protein